MKKLIQTLLICALMLFALSVTALAATEGYYTYTVSNGEATITEVDTSISGDIIIPSTLGGYPVTIVGDDSFHSCRHLTSIKIPDNVTSLGDRAFMGCRILTSVEMSDKITSIGERAFQSCEKLTNIEIPNSVMTIGIYAFNQCYRLTSIEIPDGVTTIGDNMFSFCTSLTSIKISDSVTTIGNMVFYRCGKLTSIEIPKSVTSIGDQVFYGCVELKSIMVAENNLQFSSKDGVLFDKNKTELIKYAAAKPESTYVVPDSVTTIATDAFCNCTGLTSIEISRDVTTIGGSVFEGCNGLTSITVVENNLKFSSVNGNLFDKNKTELIRYTPGKVEEKYAVPDSVITIGDGAFSNCGNLISIEIPNSVTAIGWSAFSNCENLTDIDLPDSVTTIGSEAFSNTIWYNNQPEGVVYAGKILYTYKGEMPENTTITINEGIKSISGYAFSNCTGLTSVEIPDSVTTIGERAFSNCENLTGVDIPDSVTTIGSSAFEFCRKITNIEIPDSVTNIGWRAFYNTNWYNNQADGVVYAGKVLYSYKGEMPENTTIVIENGTKGIADYALKDCSGLKSVRINDGLITIGDLAFYKCKGLKSIEIPDSVTTIGELAFRYCDAIESVYYNSDEIAWDKIKIEYGNEKLLDNVLFLSKTIDVENPGKEPINIVLIQYGPQSELLNIEQNVVENSEKEMVGIDVTTEKYKILYWKSLATLKPVYEPITKEL